MTLLIMGAEVSISCHHSECWDIHFLSQG